jgi:hypothetical protein
MSRTTHEHVAHSSDVDVELEEIAPERMLYTFED